MPRPVLLVAAANGGGHRYWHVSMLAQVAARRNFRVVVAVPPDRWDDEIALHLASARQVAELRRVDTTSLSALAAVAGQEGAAVTIVPDGDGVAMAIGRGHRWRGPGILRLLVLRWEAQPTRWSVAERAKEIGKRLLLISAAHRQRVEVFVLRSPLARGPLRLPVALDPVQVNATEDATRRLALEWGLDRDRTWLGVVGAVTARKNVGLVMEAMERVKARPLGLLVAGGIDDATRASLARYSNALRVAGHEVVVVGRPLADYELDCAIAAVDVLVLAYTYEGPSGILLKANAIGTTVIAAGARTFRQYLAVMGRPADCWCELTVDRLAEAFTAVRPAPGRRFGVHDTSEEFAGPLVTPVIGHG